MDQHADDLSALLSALGVQVPVVFVALSMGGYVAFAFWRKYASRVRAMALLDTRASADTPQAQAERHRLAASVDALGSPQPVIDVMLPRLFSPHLPRGSGIEQHVLGMMAGTPPRTVADAERGIAARPSSVSTLSTITVPTLVVVGELDALTPPSDSEEIANGVRGARLVRIAEAGHMANMENPDEVNEALLAFLRSL